MKKNTQRKIGFICKKVGKYYVLSFSNNTMIYIYKATSYKSCIDHLETIELCNR